MSTPTIDALINLMAASTTAGRSDVQALLSPAAFHGLADEVRDRADLQGVHGQDPNGGAIIDLPGVRCRCAMGLRGWRIEIQGHLAPGDAFYETGGVMPPRTTFPPSQRRNQPEQEAVEALAPAFPAAGRYRIPAETGRLGRSSRNPDRLTWDPDDGSTVILTEREVRAWVGAGFMVPLEDEESRPPGYDGDGGDP